MREIEDLLTLCRYAGTGPVISQGAGGNVSVKTADGGMWIKASGYRLSAVREGNGYLFMRTPGAEELARSVEGLDAGTANISMSNYLQSLVLDSKNLRPSLETWFHAVLGRVVLHTHPIYANAFACMDGGTDVLRKLLTNPPACVEYQTPGHLLGKAVEQSTVHYTHEQGEKPAELLLENHGLITAADSTQEAITRSEEFLNMAREFFGTLPEDSFAAGEGNDRLRRWADRLRGALVREGVHRSVSPARFVRLYQDIDNPQCAPIVPDDVVCNGAAICACDGSETAAGLLARNASIFHRPICILVRGLGFVFVAASSSMTLAMEEQLLANLLVRELIGRRGECRSLGESHISELSAMESEKHRQKVLAEGGSNCRS